MSYKLPSEVRDILNKFEVSGYQIYIVGGAVRDLILDREVKDWDFTTSATPEQILEVIPDGFYNNNFGTVGLAIENFADPFEITTMRKEGQYTDSRRPDQVSWTDKIEEDLARRDFTINALALNNKEELTDPFHGQLDISAKIIRAVGDPDKRFQEDGLRLIRAVRIATQLNFAIEEKTQTALLKNKDLLVKIAWERIRDELFKLLASKDPVMGIELLKETGLLDIILPELSQCFGVQQEGDNHDRVYDIGTHSLETLRHTPTTDPLVRLAALLHDIGKVATYKKDSSGNVTFYNHDIIGGKVVSQIAKRLRLSNDQSDRLYKLVRWHLFSVNEDLTDAAIRRFIKNIGKENIPDMMALRVGDRLGGGTQKAVSWRMEKFLDRIDEVSRKPFSVTDLKISGQDIMKELGIKPGPKVGQLLNQLFEEVLEDSSKNTREFLIGRIRQIGPI